MDKEAVAVIHHWHIIPVVPRQEAKIAVDRGPLHRGARKEARAWVIDVVDEEAAHRVRQEVREQQPMSVNDGTPRLAHAAGRGEVAGPEAAEDVGDHVVRQGFRRIHGDLHADGSIRNGGGDFGQLTY
jgi:hypothetical protein